MKILLIHHFFHPDPVVSSRIFSDLAQDLAQHGHEITVYTGNRMLGKETKLSPTQIWQGVFIRRFSRPGFRWDCTFFRLLNSFLLQIKWLIAFWHERKKYDAVIVGSDPQFSYGMLPWMRWMNRHARLILWVFDLYPEAVLASSPVWMKLPAYLFFPLAKLAYHVADDVVDIGECMKKRLTKYRTQARSTTIPPWALVTDDATHIPDQNLRQQLFGNAKLGLLYSGTIGRAHDVAPFIQLARQCRENGLDAAFCFAGCGSCFDRQLNLITAADTNIRVADYIPEADLQARLAVADIHLVALRNGWDGVVVPSKFFAALAMGKPVLFSGSEKSCIARWCQSENVGQTLNDHTMDWLSTLVDDPEEMKKWRQRARELYRSHFAYETACRYWRELLETFKTR